VFSENLTETMAAVLSATGTRRAFVVYGMEGLDEISISGPTRASEVNDGTVTNYSITPEQFGIKPSPLSSIAGGTPADNAAIIRSVLSGDKGPHRDVVLLNAGFAITAAGCCEEAKEGLALAARSIDSGAAKKKLEALAAMTARPVGLTP
jgi:anthranilate phosphoribosyltransferase